MKPLRSNPRPRKLPYVPYPVQVSSSEATHRCGFCETWYSASSSHTRKRCPRLCCTDGWKVLPAVLLTVVQV